ncbi:MULTISPECIES: glycosyltransferase family 8 protein [unclassified Bacteroides]|jgi:lipopolysaccharide biosynthesis glycosyltransferase|uniref:glycosyltransferase family 8 protein n=1 Tax=unclassified Bacteroides TaxID=2646097 RepID=UPI000E9C6825|nr:MULTISPECIES: glycosyltransferase family 8 protein [unclassified Bacteroides]RGN50209.1 glycosyltransferase family 8 protein [Bacteroides sp. OM05-12]RHR75869.1 glycosyltransferase family 8 protein [Bacteroides sp. AF16-49]
MQVKMYNVVLIADDNYASYAAVTLQSLFETNKTLYFHIYLISCGFSQINTQKIIKVCRKVNAEFDLITVNASELDDFENIGEWSKFTFLKLFIPSKLPLILDKVLYLDVDLLVVDRLQECFDLDLTGYAIAGVEDCPSCISHKERCHIPQESPYINSGFMLINLEEWRKADSQHLFLKFINENKDRMKINDQDVINSVFANKIYSLHLRYNVTNHCYGLHYNVIAKHLQQWREARRHPAIIHFTNWNKPWLFETCHEYKSLYKKYLSYISSGEVVPENERRDYLLKVKNSIKYIFVKFVDMFRLYGK